jgi:hypothetical protein
MSAGEDALARALEDLHLLVRRGRLTELGGAAEALESALAGAGPVDRAGLERLQRLARRNAESLSAAARGVRAARRRLAEIRAIGAGFVAYEPDGRRDEPAGTPGRLTRRF